jgi:hypothetical protein
MRSFVLCSAAVTLLVFVGACDNDPTEASIVNEIPDATIEKTWFRTTLFTEPVEPGQTSRTLRVGAGAEPAYAVVRIHGHSFVARTNAVVDATEADHTRIVFSPATARSLCFGEPRLAADEEELVRTRIFPGDAIATSVEECAPIP